MLHARSGIKAGLKNTSSQICSVISFCLTRCPCRTIPNLLHCSCHGLPPPWLRTTFPRPKSATVWPRSSSDYAGSIRRSGSRPPDASFESHAGATSCPFSTRGFLRLGKCVRHERRLLLEREPFGCDLEVAIGIREPFSLEALAQGLLKLSGIAHLWLAADFPADSRRLESASAGKIVWPSQSETVIS